MDTEREIEDIWVLSNPLYIVVEDSGSIVGVASISMGEDAAELFKVYVVPSQRRRGIAKRLFIETLRVLRSLNIEELFVETITSDGRDFLQAVSSEFEFHHHYEDKFSLLI